MIVGVPRETFPGERRVALAPESLQRLIAKGLVVSIQAGAGQLAEFSDDAYRKAGGRIEPSADGLFAQADFIIKIHIPSLMEIESMRQRAALVCLLQGQSRAEVVKLLAARRITVIAMENLPRTTAAQAMDVLSSQSTAAGYKAVIAAAGVLPKFFPMLMTPAGTIAPARVLVIGAGVAGLQAVATARRLGAVVEAFDVRTAAREEVESLGAKFIAAAIDEAAESAEGYARRLGEAAQQRALSVIKQNVANADVCIATALVPGQQAPILITEEMVRSMRPGSVIVDLAADQGGNCQLTQPGRDLVEHGVTIIGRFNLAAEVAVDASRMYSRNMEKLIQHFYRDGMLRVDFSDEITRRCVVTHGGEIVSEELRRLYRSEEQAEHD